MKKQILVDFNFNEFVTFSTDPGKIGVITAYLLRPGNITYGVTIGEEEVWHQSGNLQRYKCNFKVKGFAKNVG